MALTGVIAKIFQCPYIRAKTIAAVDSNPDTYTDSNNGFLLAGFKDGDVVTVSGFTTGGNNGVKTIVTVTASTIILGTALTAEIAGDDVVIVKNVPGTLIGSCHGWTADKSAETADVTTFKDTIGATTGEIDTLTFVEGGASKDTITDSNSGFIAAGFKAGDKIWITGSALNNKVVTIFSVTADTITVIATDDLTAEVLPANVTIRALNDWLKFIPTKLKWTATLDKFWSIDGESIFAVPRRYEFFIAYYASPSGPNTAYYLEGMGIASGITTQMNVLEVIKEPITIEGVGALTPKTKSTSW
jgi:hypothetical protein